MIGWLSGIVRVRDVTVGEVILDVGGVGYLVVVSWQIMAAVPDVGEACELWVHTHVREDALSLFAFATPEERRMFRLLTSVPLVGPKNAIGVLGGFPLIELLAAIGDGERRTLERIPGVGKRTAERILLDLKEKVEPLQQALAGSGKTTAPRRKSEPMSDDPIVVEAHAVLVNLGWRPKLVDAALDNVADKRPPLEDDERALDALVRLALAKLMAR
ncbi:MAG: Holliday junction branch migration protein RuvA [Nannocystaceae bacterium]|nr:Holliday junction branch migration protein RuvA [Nannocystaceae bacterium]